MRKVVCLLSVLNATCTAREYRILSIEGQIGRFREARISN